MSGNEEVSNEVGLSGCEDPRVTAAEALMSPPTTTAEGDSQAVIDYSQLRILFEAAKHGDLKILRKAAAAVKEFLLRDKTQVSMLMDSKELLPFLLKCSNAESDCVILQLNTVWTLAAILEIANKLHIREIAESGITRSLVKLLTSSDHHVLEQVTFLLDILAKDCESGIGIQDNLVSCDIFSVLTNLLKNNKNLAETMVVGNVSKIVHTFTAGRQINRTCLDNQQPWTTKEEEKDIISRLPTASVARESIPVISLLLDYNIDAIRQPMLECMCTVLVVLEEMATFVEHGLCPKLASYTSYTSEDILAGLMTALGTIGAKGDFLEFLKALKCTDGLKDFWRCLRLDASKPNYDTEEVICGVLEYSIKDLLDDDSEVIIQSGLAEGLANALKTDCFKKYKYLAMSIIGGLCNYTDELPEARQQAIANLEILPKAVKYLEADHPKAVIGAAAVIVMLVDGSPQRRNEAMSLGVLPKLLEIVEKQIQKGVFIYTQGRYCMRTILTNEAASLNCIRALNNILRVEPRPSIHIFQRVLQALVKCLDSNRETTRDNIEVKAQAILCITEFVESGAAERKLVFDKPNLVQELLNFLQCDELPLQQSAVQFVLKTLQRGSAQDRNHVLELDVLKRFDKLLKAESKKVRLGALDCLLLFLTEELAAAQRAAIDELKSNVLEEIKKEIPDTLERARSVYQRMIN